MAAGSRTVTVHVLACDVEVLDELCTTCWLPSMLRVTVVTTYLDRVGSHVRVFCRDCRAAE